MCIPIVLGTRVHACVQFQLSWSTITGVASEIEPGDSTALDVTVLHSAWSHRIRALFCYLPISIQKRACGIWPAYFVPDILVLNKLVPGREREFRRSQATYQLLDGIQGDREKLPIYYGNTWFEGAPAFVIASNHSWLMGRFWGGPH